MRERMHDIVARYSSARAQEQKDRALFRARHEVDINANGTSGYVVKHGTNAGKVLKHIKIEPNEI
jgi:hypothetical protein